jgi:hypothetical protein
MLQINCMNGDQICQGFSTENQAQLEVSSALPLRLPEQTYVTYTWMSTHANGTKVWDTGLPTRRVPVPWTGEYTVQVQAQYIREGERRPYAVFWSNKVVIMGKTCTPTP